MNLLLSHNGGEIKATVNLPASKSISNRVLIIRALCDEYFSIANLARCDDTDIIQNVLNSSSNKFDVSNAGTAMRFLTAYAATVMGRWEIWGNERMHQRPIEPLVKALRELGAEVEYIEKENYPPLAVTGTKLKGGHIQISGDVSSQFVSALLMIAPSFYEGLTLEIIPPLISKPYILMTLKLMEYFGIKSHWNGTTIKILPQKYVAKKIQIEADWSAAAFWYQMAALSSKANIRLKGLVKESIQGDSIQSSTFFKIGVTTKYYKESVGIERSSFTKKILEIDCSYTPDLVMSYAVSFAMLRIPFVLKGVATLAHKESNRIQAIQEGLSQLGCLVEYKNNQLIFDGVVQQVEKIPNINTYNDHRIAMSFAPVALLRPLVICEADCVSKSYPDFWEQFAQAGFKIEKISD